MARAPRSTAKKPKLRALPGRAPSPAPVNPRARDADDEAALTYARGVLEAEARAILGVTDRLGDAFLRALKLVRDCPGQVVVTGMGKAGHIGQKLSSTLASTGIRSVFLHPAEAVHGDLGRVGAGDVILALSNSGSTEELLRLLPLFKRMGTPVVALTGDADSPLAKGAEVVLDIGRIEEACPMGLVPTASTAALHAVGDALAMTLLRSRPFGRDDYALLHPGGKLGRSVLRVFELMRTGPANPLVLDTARLSQAVVVMTNTPGRPGAACVVDRDGKLEGIFTDGDLRRLVERGHTDFEVPVRQVMGKRPRCITPDTLVLTAATQMRELRVDQLPVVDVEGRAVGLLDVQDLLAAKFV
ncbi:KpsF/GutQ family sugar-phosphate isomerase [Corallococcus exiguus]|uniref:KpsF/GutQ family sugar-phosphate isomerase n=2 Tax=Corallococcus exiguus TaxID=83462 RepID=A0A7Y1WYC5_9BACT|nr:MULTISPECIES: KpsF/GutQ family sugar-phosphate isomerase [Corallococcus]NBC40956.1 KpsF/GutQ family sugar-phosphate isomerase [Corallococcus exiguus]NNC19486.1 KpsF/GutQ family sugar-phosphate isomerase [Corallococcus exiguus]RKH25807.1 KpsF/GutQ family sugar-phosphate isomerase [Corallococcus sp. CA041A]RKI16671.1 KpsF/GutQ family sugar-phosphate isomerase [Corallococcus sp. AB030]TNV54610.1 KpsF/GutQ family sugar-phosphate isomerase [Corallococcus exiguus]